MNQSSPSTDQTSSRGGLLSLRAAVVLLVAIVVGCVAGCLAFLAGQPIAGAILIGGGAVGASLGLADTLVQDR